MKLSLETLARAIGDSRAEFYSFYAPSWSNPAALEKLRAELDSTRTSRHAEPRRSPLAVRSLHPRTESRVGSRLPRAA